MGLSTLISTQNYEIISVKWISSILNINKVYAWNVLYSTTLTMWYCLYSDCLSDYHLRLGHEGLKLGVNIWYGNIPMDILSPLNIFDPLNIFCSSKYFCILNSFAGTEKQIIPHTTYQFCCVPLEMGPLLHCVVTMRAETGRLNFPVSI